MACSKLEARGHLLHKTGTPPNISAGSVCQICAGDLEFKTLTMIMSVRAFDFFLGSVYLAITLTNIEYCYSPKLKMVGVIRLKYYPTQSKL